MSFQRDSDNQTVSILLQNAETVALVCSPQGNSFCFPYFMDVWVIPFIFLKCYLLPYSGDTLSKTAVPVTSLKVGDEVLLRVQGGARHTGIEIQEFIVENWTNNVFKWWFFIQFVILYVPLTSSAGEDPEATSWGCRIKQWKHFKFQMWQHFIITLVWG